MIPILATRCPNCASELKVAKAVKGNRFQVLGEDGKGNLRWYKVKLEDGREAWVASSVVSLEPSYSVH